MNCWLIFFLLICGGNCKSHMAGNWGCNQNGCRNECKEERREECCEVRRDECQEVRRDEFCVERREERREDNRYGMNTPPWARSGEHDRDDSCGCQNR